jgi:predicted transcriptional regulator
MLEIFIYPIGLIAGFAVSYYLTPKIIRLFLGDILVYTDKGGKRYRVWRRRNETEQSAIARLKLKVAKARFAKS